MAGTHEVRSGGSGEDMSSFWLPPNTVENGLSAGSFALIAETDPARADVLMQSLAQAGVPARLALPAPGAARGTARVFVDPSCYGRAENVLLAEMHRSTTAPPHGCAETRSETSPPTRAEAKQLWWFCDGAIMDPGTRDGLWRARGLCPRHSWMFLCAETELRWQPLGVAVLYADLTRRMVESLRRRRRRTPALRDDGTCSTCDFVAVASGRVTGFADERERMAAAARTSDWVARSQPVWSRVACAQCLPRADVSSAVTCRLHLLAIPDAAEVAGATAYLRGLAGRLGTCVKSMTYEGPPHTPESDAALVEALGWFAGWRAGAPYLDPAGGSLPDCG